MHRRHHVAVLALAFALPASAFSQNLPEGVQKGPSIEGITEYTFPNGLRVLLCPDPSNPKVTVNMTYLVGSRHEGYGETGMAHLLEHLLFIETTNGRQIKNELTGRGAAFNGTTSVDRTNYFETVAANDDNLRWALGLEADRMVNARLEKAILDTEMTVVRNEFERAQNDPQRALMERLSAAAYIWHNYGKTTLGSRSDIENMPIDRLAAFYRKYYRPDNAVLAIAGQFHEAKTLAFVAETVGRIPRPFQKLEETYTVEPPQDGERYVAVRRVGNQQTVVVAYHVPAAAHADSAALRVLSHIMSGNVGRLYKGLVDNKKAVMAGTFSSQRRDPGQLVAFAALSKDQSLSEARPILIRIVEGLAQEPPSEEEVERVRQELLTATERDLANSQSLALNLSEWAAMGDWRLLFLNRDRIRNVSPEDVARVGRTYLMESNRTVAEFIPVAKPERAEVPAAPSLVAILRDYKGGEAVSQGEAFDPTPAAIEGRLVRVKLPNGLKLAMLPRKTRGATVSAIIALQFGDETSLVGKSAVAHLTGGLLMRGTRNKTREQLQQERSRLKALMSVNGGVPGTPRRGGLPIITPEPAAAGAFLQTTADNLEGSLRLAVEMLREPAFPDAEFDQVRRQIIAAIESGRTEPETLAELDLQRHLRPNAPGHPRYLPTFDERIAEFRKLTVEDVKQFHMEFYGASSAEVVVMGEFDPSRVREAVAGLLGSWNSPKPYRRLATPYRKIEPLNRKVETPDKQNSTFRAGTPIRMSDEHPDYPAMLLANQMFGGSIAARMPHRIRNVEGLSYGVRSRFSAPTEGDGALFDAWAISAPQNTPKVEASFLDELTRTLKNGFTAEEVATAKKAYQDEQPVARSQQQTLLSILAGLERDGRTMKWWERLDAAVQSLTPEQINSAFRRHVSPDAMSIVKAGDFSKAGAYQQPTTRAAP